jgi:hypothetical protein
VSGKRQAAVDRGRRPDPRRGRRLKSRCWSLTSARRSRSSRADARRFGYRSIFGCCRSTVSRAFGHNADRRGGYWAPTTPEDWGFAIAPLGRRDGEVLPGRAPR